MRSRTFLRATIILLLGFVASQAWAGPLTGNWTGLVGGSGALQMNLTEVSPNAILGYAVVDWGVRRDSLVLISGAHTEVDSVLLTAYCWPDPPALRLDIFEGLLQNGDIVTGVYWSRRGSDNPVTLPWSATRVPMAVFPTTWGRVKGLFRAMASEPNRPLQPTGAAGPPLAARAPLRGARG